MEHGHADRLIVDELMARREAHRRHLPVLGTLGVWRSASHAGLLSLPLAIARLEKTSFRMAANLVHSLLAEDAERAEGEQQP